MSSTDIITGSDPLFLSLIWYLWTVGEISFQKKRSVWIVWSMAAVQRSHQRALQKEKRMVVLQCLCVQLSVFNSLSFKALIRSSRVAIHAYCWEDTGGLKRHECVSWKTSTWWQYCKLILFDYEYTFCQQMAQQSHRLQTAMPQIQWALSLSTWLIILSSSQLSKTTL